MKRTRFASGAALAAAAVIAILGQTGCKSMNDEEIKASIEITDVSTNWTMKEYRQWPNPKLTLVPTVTFRIHNLTGETLKYININAIFRAENSVENLGDHFKAVIRDEGIPPNDYSPYITLKSNFGVSGTTLNSFQNNPFWQIHEVRLFAQMGGSRHVPMGEWKVSRDIDFKEDTAVPTDKKEPGADKLEPEKK
ncbi:MAG: hypothetical protein JW843_09025 [Candidatus Aminicenantes bacterium]|nr:hypothetical protein [Candidatus Aminicenantes bacterium]